MKWKFNTEIIARHVPVHVLDFILTHSHKFMIIELAWCQLLFSNLLGGGNHKISKGQTFRPQMWALFSARFF